MVEWLVLSALLSVLCSCATTRQYSVAPIGRKTNVRIFATAPPGWGKNLLADVDYRMGFSPIGRKGPPYLSVIAFTLGDSYFSGPAREPQSFLVWETETETKNIRLERIGSFDAGPNGELPLWRAHTPIDNFVVTVFFPRERLEVAVFLRGPNADELERYVDSVKDMARSVRAVSP